MMLKWNQFFTCVHNTVYTGPELSKHHTFSQCDKHFDSIRSHHVKLPLLDDVHLLANITLSAHIVTWEFRRLQLDCHKDYSASHYITPYRGKTLGAATLGPEFPTNLFHNPEINHKSLKRISRERTWNIRTFLSVSRCTKRAISPLSLPGIMFMMDSSSREALLDQR